MRKPKPPTDKQAIAALFESRLAGRPRRAPVCPHFGECGGCSFQDVDYPELVAVKREVCLALAERAGVLPLLDGVEVDAFASPLPYGYRQRMDFVCAFGMSGLRRRRRHRQVVELSACPLLGGAGFAAFRRAAEVARQLGWPDYDYMRHHGDLRYVVVRQTAIGERLVSLVAKTPEHGDDARRVAGTLLSEGRADSVYWLLAPGLGDVSFGEPLAHWGKPAIEERLDGMTFLLGPNTFFQANPRVAARAYRDLADAAAAAPPGSALDLYSGTGVIAAWLAAAGRRVTAVENVPDNVRLAAANARANGLDGRIALREEDAGEYLRRLAGTRADGCDGGAGGGDGREAAAAPAVVVVNPPRPGVDPGGLDALLALSPGRILYLSCNPATLWRDVARLAPGYRPSGVRVYDMFPQTPHFETLAVLDKKP